MFNTELAIDVLAQIELTQSGVTREGTWRQDRWGVLDRDSLVTGLNNHDLIYTDDGEVIGLGTCGSGMCFAGWGLSFSDIKMVWKQEHWTSSYYADTVEDGREIADAAMQLFGIEDHSGCDAEDDECDVELWDHAQELPSLFHPQNDLQALYLLVAAHSGLDEDDLRQKVEDRMLARVRSATRVEPVTPSH